MILLSIIQLYMNVTYDLYTLVVFLCFRLDLAPVAPHIEFLLDS